MIKTKQKMIIPDNVLLETSALCNLSCLGCALHGPESFVQRPFGNMKKEVWETVLKEIGSWDKKVEVMAHGGGEPLLNPKLKEIITFAKSFSNIKIGFLTNGMLLDESWAEFLIDINLDWIALSIDGVVSETHDAIRKNSNLLKVEKNLNRFLEIKKSKGVVFPDVKLNMVAYNQIINQQDDFIQKWINKVDSVMISCYRNPPSSKRWPGVHGKRKKCKLLWSQAVVAWDGRLGLCCEDFNMDFSAGKIGNGKGLLELWNNSNFSELRKLHSKGLYNQHPMCKSCDTWAEDYVRKKSIDKKNGYLIMKSPSQTVYQVL